ncbi:molybdopterin biosynthesis protein MoeY [Sediminicurvatus halobius]|nr:molybdopterin biosynthesis protein MoeY [Spiribacter halobius]UEX77369.1 hypothetical protein LMH63_15680 [Spiribacter halobius]
MTGDQQAADRLRALLERARWAPSGDNAQPWRFRMHAPDGIEILAADTAEEVLYDYHGGASLLAVGALLETLRLAARASGQDARVETVQRAGHELCVRTRISPTDDPEDPLHAAIERRTTHRRALSPKPISESDRRTLSEALPKGYELIWRLGWGQRGRIARLLWRNAGIRLTTPEAFPVHRDAIEWGARESRDRIPAAAVGMDPLGLALMRWAMRSWRRVDVLNRYFGGTWLPRLQLDLIPALFCGGHFLLLAPSSPVTIDDHLAAGGAVQRLWLQAAAMGIQFQPAYTPIVFHRYVHSGERFTRAERPWRRAQRLAAFLEDEFGTETLPRAVFMGRMGYGQPPQARSIRWPLAELLVD